MACPLLRMVPGVVSDGDGLTQMITEQLGKHAAGTARQPTWCERHNQFNGLFWCRIRCYAKAQNSNIEKLAKHDLESLGLE